MKLAIVTATYQRKDGSTPRFLERALNSIKNQTHQDYKLFLIGDKYEDSEEFNKLCEMIDSDKLSAINLPYAAERDRYIDNPSILWACGGVNAVNTGVEMALAEGFDFICHLDHDDIWEPDHLEEINRAITNNPDASCIFTLANYLHQRTLPEGIEADGCHVFGIPQSSNVIHSATCVNFRKHTLRYRDTHKEFGAAYASDADLWDRVGYDIHINGYKSILIRKITCIHDLENH